MKYFFTKYRLFLSGAALILTAASCTSTLSDEPATDARAISFTPAAETRAAVGTDFPKGSSFSVWGWYGTTGSTIDKTVFNNIPVTKSGEVWTYTGGTQYWISGMTYNFYGVYPIYPKTSDNNGTTATVTPDGTITVTNFDCFATGDAAIDLMTATHTRDYNGTNANAVNMPFQHELAKVKFTVKSENTVATVSRFNVYGVNYQGTLTKKGQTATWNPVTACTETNTPYKLENFTFNTTNGFEKDMLGDVLLIPDKDLTDAKLYIAYRYQGETTDRTSTINLQTTAITQWEAGKSYHYTLTIKGGTLTVTVTVADWKEEDTSVSWG